MDGAGTARPAPTRWVSLPRRRLNCWWGADVRRPCQREIWACPDRWMIGARVGTSFAGFVACEVGGRRVRSAPSRVHRPGRSCRGSAPCSKDCSGPRADRRQLRSCVPVDRVKSASSVRGERTPARPFAHGTPPNPATLSTPRSRPIALASLCTPAKSAPTRISPSLVDRARA